MIPASLSAKGVDHFLALGRPASWLMVAAELESPRLCCLRNCEYVDDARRYRRAVRWFSFGVLRRRRHGRGLGNLEEKELFEIHDRREKSGLEA